MGDGIVPAFWAFWGMSLGSFVNVLAYRLPRGESIWRPASHCPRCGRPVAVYDNIPLLSFALLRGRCRACRGRISWRYPLVEALMVAAALGLWWRWRLDPYWVVLSSGAAAALVAVALIDWETFLIPDALSLGLLAAGFAASPFNPVLGDAWGWRVLRCAAGAAFGFALCWAVAEAGERLFKKEAMGGGDIKLLAAVGAWTGALGAFDCLLVGSFIGAAYGVWLLARGKVRRQDPIPFGPFLSAGAALDLFYILPFGFPFN